MIRYQDFNFDTISIRYLTQYRNIDIDILNNEYINLIQAYTSMSCSYKT